MSVFNSLGTNYSAKMVWQAMLPARRSAITKLQDMLRDHYGAADVVLTNRGREAIVLILRNLQLPEGSYVAITGYTCYVVYEAVVAAGLQPYFIDIAKNDLNFNMQSLKAALAKEPAIKAVLIQNTLGLPADIVSIEKLCEEQGAFLIEDLAHSAGLTYADGREAGTVGVATALSFSQNKMIDASAGGAALFRTMQVRPGRLKSVHPGQRFTNYLYPLTTYIIRKTHRYGVGKVLLKLVKFLHILPDPAGGYAGDIHGLPAHQAKLAGQYIAKLQQTIEHRRSIAEIYQQTLPRDVQFPASEGAVYIRFPIRVKDQSGLERYLKKYQINLGTSWYETVIAPRRFLKRATLYQPGLCPNGEWMAEHIINLPTHININQETAHVIAGKVNEWLQSE